MALARVRVSALVGLLVLGYVTSGCLGGNRDSGTAGTAGTVDSIRVRTTSTFVSIANNTGTPLRDVRVTINPIGRPMPFSAVIARIDPGEQRDVSLGTFRGADGAAFNAMFIRPKTVSVSAVDIDGKKYETTTPWKG